jgi:WD40 repeat protein
VVNSDGALSAGVGSLAQVPMWDSKTGDPLPMLSGHRGGTLAGAFSHDERMLVTGGRDRMLRFWDLWTSGERLAAIEHPAWICSVACSPKGKVVATADVTGTIRLWNMQTGKLLVERRGHRGPVSALLFAESGKSLISAGQDTTILVWDVPSVPRLPRSEKQALTDVRRKMMWQKLLEIGDLAGVGKAMSVLAADPEKTVAFVRPQLVPPDSKLIDKLISQLDDEKYEVRNKASAALARLGSYAREPLRQALLKKPSLETVRAIEKLLKPLADGRLMGERLRALRGVELLEMIDTKSAHEALMELRKGKNAELARQAKAALERLGK